MDQNIGHFNHLTVESSISRSVRGVGIIVTEQWRCHYAARLLSGTVSAGEILRMLGLREPPCDKCRAHNILRAQARRDPRTPIPTPINIPNAHRAVHVDSRPSINRRVSTEPDRSFKDIHADYQDIPDSPTLLFPSTYEEEASDFDPPPPSFYQMEVERALTIALTHSL